MNETLTNFRQAVADSTDLQEKVKYPFMRASDCLCVT